MQQLPMRRIKLKENGAVYQLRPDFLMPYMIGKTDEMEKPLFLCRFGLPFEAIATRGSNWAKLLGYFGVSGARG